MENPPYESYKHELRYLVNCFILNDNLQLLPYINELIVKISIEEDCFDLLTNLKTNE